MGGGQWTFLGVSLNGFVHPWGNGVCSPHPQEFLSKTRYALGVSRFPQDQQPNEGAKKGQFWWLAKHKTIGISVTHALATYEILIIRV